MRKSRKDDMKIVTHLVGREADSGSSLRGVGRLHRVRAREVAEVAFVELAGAETSALQKRRLSRLLHHEK